MHNIKLAKGMVYDIQRYSLHDGPGIRTIVFLKGCPLRCLWCSNPESHNIYREEMNGKIVGEMMSVDQVINICKRDMVFYEGSGGGVTISGGEPLMQPDYITALAAELKREKIHVAVETSGFAKWSVMEDAIKDIDLILMDIKDIRDDNHIANTGVSNISILENAANVVKMGKEIVVRIPLIPDHNDSFKSVLEICQFAEEIGVGRIEVLPYHRLGQNKYSQLGRIYKLKDLQTKSFEEIEVLISSVRAVSDIAIEVIK